MTHRYASAAAPVVHKDNASILLYHPFVHPKKFQSTQKYSTIDSNSEIHKNKFQNFPCLSLVLHIVSTILCHKAIAVSALLLVHVAHIESYLSCPSRLFKNIIPQLAIVPGPLVEDIKLAIKNNS